MPLLSNGVYIHRERLADRQTVIETDRQRDKEQYLPKATAQQSRLSSPSAGSITATGSFFWRGSHTFTAPSDRHTDRDRQLLAYWRVVVVLELQVVAHSVNTVIETCPQTYTQTVTSGMDVTVSFQRKKRYIQTDAQMHNVLTRIFTHYDWDLCQV